MVDPSRVRALLDELRPGLALPGAFYTDPELFHAELDAVFAAEWLFACNACEIRRPGDYLTLEIGADSIIVVRDRKGRVGAFHNTCRHRGSRLCRAETGHANQLVCPYHYWSYDLEGSLLHARKMPAAFDRSGYGLKPIHVEVICGLVFVCLAGQAPDLAPFRAAVTPYIAPHQPERTRVAHVSTIVEEANWKLVIENNRECYHCNGNHPELLASLVEFGLPDDPAGDATFRDLMARKAGLWDRLGLPHAPAEGGAGFLCVRLPFHDGAVSFTRDGGPACRKLLGGLTEPDLGSVRMFRAPNNWHHFLGDHIIHFRVLPLGPDRTAVRTTWLVHEEAVEGEDYDLGRLTEVWQATNDQDRRLCENNQLGVASRAYEPGPYAPDEFMLRDFTAWYADRLGDRARRGFRVGADGRV